MPTGRTGAGETVPGRNTDGPEGSECAGQLVGSSATGTGGDSGTGSTAGSEGTESIGLPMGDSAGESSNSPGAVGSAWELPSEGELELPPRVEIQPWGDHTLALVLREGARVADLRGVLRFLPDDAALEGVYGDVEFDVVFEIPRQAES